MASCAAKPYPEFDRLLTPELRARLSLLSGAERDKLLSELALTLVVKDRPFPEAK
jgi:hypothetical protein